MMTGKSEQELKLAAYMMLACEQALLVVGGGRGKEERAWVLLQTGTAVSKHLVVIMDLDKFCKP